MGDRLSPEGRSPSILGLGTSKRYGDFSALENVPAELRAIVQDGTAKGIYPGKIKLNEAFTAKSLSENLNSFRVLHIATHGSFNPKSITASFLLLGNGDRLPITDIAALNNSTAPTSSSSAPAKRASADRDRTAPKSQVSAATSSVAEPNPSSPRCGP